MLSVVIPANNEEAIIGDCLSALGKSDKIPGTVEVIVAANGCTDNTVGVCETFRDRFEALGWSLHILDLADGGKLGALNAAEAKASGDIMAYLDADVSVSPPLMAGIVRTLRRDEPAYASGRVNITAKGAFSAAYARNWARVPFMTTNVPGCGLFAMNAAGRARWGEWPAIISDDGFARLQFTPDERHLVDAPYDWPIAEGFSTLVKVRRRQDTGVDELREKFPQIMANDGTPGLGASGMLKLAMRDPIAFAAYASVSLMVKIRGPEREWSRSR